MGAVYLVKDRELNNDLKALKIMLPKLLNNKAAHQRFRNEILISQKLTHQNILKVIKSAVPVIESAVPVIESTVPVFEPAVPAIINNKNYQKTWQVSSKPVAVTSPINNEIWQELWNKERGYADFTNESWINLSWQKQYEYAKSYQQWYAEKNNLAVETVKEVIGKRGLFFKTNYNLWNYDLLQLIQKSFISL